MDEYETLRVELEKRYKSGQNPVLVSKEEHDILDKVTNNGKKHCIYGVDIEIKDAKD